MTTRCNLPKNLRPMFSQRKAGHITIIQNGRNVVIPETGYVQRTATFQAAERLVDNIVQAMQVNENMFGGEAMVIVENPCVTGRVCAPRRKVNSSALRRGTKVEMEHTRNRKVAATIARAHLAELPDYYARLAKMERRNPRFPMLAIKEVAGKRIALDGVYIQMDKPRLLRKYSNLATARRVFNGLDDGWRLGRWMQVTETLLGRRK